ERTAADGAGERAIRRNDHARANLARARALRLRQSHQRRRAVLCNEPLDGRPNGHRGHQLVTACTARRIDSGVAGASSGTGLSGLSEWIASAIAAKTEIASISGGSPTALEGWIVSSRFAPSHRAMSKCSGTSEAQGIL